MPRAVSLLVTGFVLAGCNLGGAPPAPQSLGEATFARVCAGCHGSLGKGDGPAAGFLYPRPRDFTLAKFKFGGSPQEIARTITRGIPGTSMPSFAGVLTPAEIEGVAQHIRHLTGETTPPSPAALPVLPEGIGSVERGRAAFATNCAPCHGPAGHGDGPSALVMKDDWGIPIRPRNLTIGRLKGGETPEEIYLRIRGGIPGSPMPAFRDLIADSSILDLVAFVRSLRPAVSDIDFRGLVAKRVAALPEDVEAAAWTGLEPVPLELHPLWMRPDWPVTVNVRALHDGKKVAFLIEWPDTSPDRRLGAVTDFLDAAALMIPFDASQPPFIGMGSAGEAQCRIFHWRALQERQGPASATPNVIRDTNPWEDRIFARPAAAAGNPLAALEGRAILEYIASGFGTLTIVPPGRADAKAVYRSGADGADGRWCLLLVLGSEVRGEPSLAPGTRTSVSLAIWDGSKGDRNGQKSITAWIPLEVEE